jgi:outer membrane lipoprotein-sorting protein
MIRCLLGVAFIAALLSVSAHAQKTPAKPAVAGAQHPFALFTHFSATMTGGLLKDEPRKVYRSGNLMRVDLDNEFHVTDLAGGTTWVVRPESCTHVPGPDARSYPFSAYRDAKFELLPGEEKETIDGHPCKIATASVTPKDTSLTMKMKIWHAEDLQGFPVKIEVAHSARTMTVSYKDVSVESPDAKLFMLPAKCPDFRTGEPQGGKKPAVKKPAAKPVAPPVQKPPQQ